MTEITNLLNSMENLVAKWEKTNNGYIFFLFVSDPYEFRSIFHPQYESHIRNILTSKKKRVATVTKWIKQ